MTQNQLIELIESEQVKALVERSEERGVIEPAEFEAFVLERLGHGEVAAATQRPVATSSREALMEELPMS